MDEDEQFEEGNLPIDIINSEEDKIPEPEGRKEDGKTSQIILMKAQTWDRESHGLYDYESRRVQKFERKVENEGCMVRDKEDVRFWENHHPYDSQEETFLFKLVSKDNKFYVNPINDNPANDRLWLVIRSLRNGYTIQSHDILKLGRMKFKVKEFRSEHEYFEGEHVEKSPHQGFEELHEVQVAESDDIMCRFCWVGEQTEENPIIGS